MLFTHFAWIDYLILLMILFVVIICYRKGFVGSTLTLVCWVIAIAGSFKLSHPVGNIFQNVIESEYMRTILGFFIAFIVLALIGVLILYLFNHLVEKATLHKTDKILGGFSGIVVGIFVVSALLLVARYSTMPTKPFWTKSYLIPYFYPFEDVINDFLPTAVQAERDLMPDSVEKKMEDGIEGMKEAKEKVSDKIEKVQKAQEKAVDAAEELTD